MTFITSIRPVGEGHYSSSKQLLEDIADTTDRFGTPDNNLEYNYKAKEHTKKQEKGDA